MTDRRRGVAEEFSRLEEATARLNIAQAALGVGDLADTEFRAILDEIRRARRKLSEARQWYPVSFDGLGRALDECIAGHPVLAPCRSWPSDAFTRRTQPLMKLRLHA